MRSRHLHFITELRAQEFARLGQAEVVKHHELQASVCFLIHAQSIFGMLWISQGKWNNRSENCWRYIARCINFDVTTSWADDIMSHHVIMLRNQHERRRIY